MRAPNGITSHIESSDVAAQLRGFGPIGLLALSIIVASKFPFP